jgi:hypothetical protein
MTGIENTAGAGYLVFPDKRENINYWVARGVGKNNKERPMAFLAMPVTLFGSKGLGIKSMAL